MVYSEDSTDNGKKCKVLFKSKLIDCEIICFFIRAYRNGLTTKRYRLKLSNNEILDNVLFSSIILN